MDNRLTDNFGYPNGREWCEDDGRKDSFESGFDFKGFYRDNLNKINLISFKTTDEKERREKLSKETVLKITKITKENKQVEYHALTGNYVGIINIVDGRKTSVQIESRFSNTFLSHMLNYFNDIFVINAGDSFKRNKEIQSDNVIQYILCHLFVRSLDKASGSIGTTRSGK